MQQTQKYKLNLIERDDPFLPEALNANTQKVEDVLIDKMEGPVTELDGRVTVLECRKAVFGCYNSKLSYDLSYDLGFRPKAILICSIGGTPRLILSTDTEEGQHNDLVITDTGFFIHSIYVTGPHAFIAFG